MVLILSKFHCITKSVQKQYHWARFIFFTFLKAYKGINFFSHTGIIYTGVTSLMPGSPERDKGDILPKKGISLAG